MANVHRIVLGPSAETPATKDLTPYILEELTTIRAQIASLDLAFLAALPASMQALTATVNSFSNRIDTNCGSIANLTQQVNTINSQMESLNESVNGMEEQIAVLDFVYLTQLPPVVEQLKNGLVTIGVGLNATNTTVGQLQTGLSELNTGQAILTTELATTNSNVGQLQTVQATTHADVAQLQTGQTTLISNLTVTNNNVRTLQTGQTTLTTNINTLTANMTTTNNNVRTLQTGQATLTANLTTTRNDVGALQTGLTTLQQNVSALTGNVTTIAATLQTTNQALTALDQEITTLQNDIAPIMATVAQLAGLEDLLYLANNGNDDEKQGLRDLWVRGAAKEIFYFAVEAIGLKFTETYTKERFQREANLAAFYGSILAGLCTGEAETANPAWFIPTVDGTEPYLPLLIYGANYPYVNNYGMTAPIVNKFNSEYNKPPRYMEKIGIGKEIQS